MLLRPDYVGDLHIMVVHDVGQVVETGAVGALDNVILLRGPLHFHRSADKVVELASPGARHFETHDSLTSLSFVTRTIGSGLGQPFAAIKEWTLLLLGRFTL